MTERRAPNRADPWWRHDVAKEIVRDVHDDGCQCRFGWHMLYPSCVKRREEVAQRIVAALASPPSAPAASGAPPHDAAEELTCLREMYQDALRDMDKMLADFAAALGLPDPVQGTESPGYPHILAAINALRAGPVPEFVEHLGAHDGPCDNTEVCTECGQSKGGCGVHGENFMRRRKAALAALSPQASDREAEPGAMGAPAAREQAETTDE